MTIKDLYKVMDAWTNITVEDLYDEEEVYDGLMVGLEMGIKDENSENILFDESLERILNMNVVEVEIEAENKIHVIATK